MNVQRSRYRAVFGPIAVVVLFAAGMRWSPFEPHRAPADPSGTPGGTPSWLDGDWAVFERTVREAHVARMDTLPMGALMAALGRGFVGTPYVPQTLEVDGPERLVINFQALDCVTFVENVFALARFVKSGGGARLEDRGQIEGEYERLLRSLRYRNDVIDRYPSRLHYFTDWIGENERKLLLHDISEELGGVVDREPIDFMTTHREAYRQLSDSDAVDEMRRIEMGLSASGRHYVPEERIGDVAGDIRDGDVIAATSTVGGLDVAHTGLALWVDGTLRLLHAPLVGEAVQISETSLADRITQIEGQDGIIVARPLEPFASTSRQAPR